MLKYITSGWTMLKGVRVGLGLLILYSGIESHSFGGIMAGAFFTLFGLISPGTCCSSSCYTTYNKEEPDDRIENIEYEEVGIK